MDLLITTGVIRDWEYIRYTHRKTFISVKTVIRSKNKNNEAVY
jgi:hypothetical protein